MRFLPRSPRVVVAGALAAGAATAALAVSVLRSQVRPPAPRTTAAANAPCAAGDAGLALPDGFCAGLFAKALGSVRHMTFGPDGALYAATSGGFLRGGVTGLRDRDGDGVADERATFGPRGVNDVAVHDGFLYLALRDQVVRFRLTAGRLEPPGPAEAIVTGLPDDGDHGEKTFAFPGGDRMIVKVGSATNSCQQSNRRERSPGRSPCAELERRAGLWRFDATRAGQRFEDGRRWATGLRNAEALAVQPGRQLVWAAVHGRDQLGDNWGYSAEANANNPAEELVQVSEGDDLGWPYCFYSNDAKRKVLAPEYGGDGRTAGRCADMKPPAIAFPGHWAPMALAFYPGAQFGPAFQGGLFVSFHGSWNRAPEPQAGFRVVFAPFADGKPAGSYQTFATLKQGRFRPVGLAVGPDGGLYLAADNQPTIWRVVKR